MDSPVSRKNWVKCYGLPKELLEFYIPLYTDDSERLCIFKFVILSRQTNGLYCTAFSLSLCTSANDSMYILVVIKRESNSRDIACKLRSV